SFSFLLYAAYCMALCFLLPRDATGSNFRLQSLRFDLSARTSQPVLVLSVLFFAGIDMVIDPVALRGDRWFLGQIYYYSEPGLPFGVPVTNYLGWMIVGLISLSLYFPMDRQLPPPHAADGPSTTGRLLLGVSLYYGVLVFNLAVTFWIGEIL